MSTIDAILGHIGTIVNNTHEWRVGMVPDRPETCPCGAPGQPWHAWDAESRVAAVAIVECLEARGMRRDDLDSPLAVWVYIRKPGRNPRREKPATAG